MGEWLMVGRGLVCCLQVAQERQAEAGTPAEGISIGGGRIAGTDTFTQTGLQASLLFDILPV